jgi:two-component system, OmpR family, phosphate regulon response regulator PhoB
MAKQTVLIIEDERSLVDVLSYNLRKEGFEVVAATDGQDGLRRAQTVLPDLIVLDLMIPVIEGLEVCRQLRAGTRTRDIPILMLTARSEEIDEVVGFQMGADDYVTKPFKLKPLIQRIKALLRRKQSGESDVRDTAAAQGIEIDRRQHRAILDGIELKLTPTEFRLLWTLVRQPGRAFSRQELMEAGMGDDALVLERTVDVHIKSLRQKLGDKGDLIETVRGVGYRFREEQTAPAGFSGTGVPGYDRLPSFGPVKRFRGRHGIRSLAVEACCRRLRDDPRHFRHNPGLSVQNADRAAPDSYRRNGPACLK